MPLIRITKQDVDNARKAREAALKKDPNLRAFEEEMEREEKEAMEEGEKEAK
jgi:hypothetical protein